MTIASRDDHILLVWGRTATRGLEAQALHSKHGGGPVVPRRQTRSKTSQASGSIRNELGSVRNNEVLPNMTWEETVANASLASGLGGIECQVLNRIGSRLMEFSVDEVENRLVLRGRAASYHVKQLVQHEVMGLSSLPIQANQIEVVN